MVICKRIISILLEVSKLRANSQLLGKDIVVGIHIYICGGFVRNGFFKTHSIPMSQNLLIIWLTFDR